MTETSTRLYPLVSVLTNLPINRPTRASACSGYS